MDEFGKKPKFKPCHDLHRRSHPLHDAAIDAPAAAAAVPDARGRRGGDATSTHRPTADGATAASTRLPLHSSALAFAGSGALVAVGYMDPGNWATDISAGSQFGYALLSVVLMSNLIAVLLQCLAVRVGVVTGQDLARQLRSRLPWGGSVCLWVLAELSILATDLAEVVGAAIALRLLLGVPLAAGVVVTFADVFVVLAAWDARSFRVYCAAVLALIAAIGACFAVLVARVRPDWGAAAAGYVPSPVVVSSESALVASLGIIGATVMPHNLYLHSALVLFQAPIPTVHPLPPDHGPSAVATATASPLLPHRVLAPGGVAAIRSALRRLNVDLVASLAYATLVNSAILIVAAAATATASAAAADGEAAVDSVEGMYNLLDELVGRASAIVFAVGLLLAGQSATITGTLAGQIVMEGFAGHWLGEDDADGDGGADADDDDESEHKGSKAYAGGAGESDGSGGGNVPLGFLVAQGGAPPPAAARRDDSTATLGDDAAATTAVGLEAGCAVGDNIQPAPSATVAVDDDNAAGDTDAAAAGPRGPRGRPRLRLWAWLREPKRRGQLRRQQRPRRRGGLLASALRFVRRRAWARRLATRAAAAVPALVCAAALGPGSVDRLLSLSQVALSLLLPFAVWPLVVLASSHRGMEVAVCRCSGSGGSGGAGGEASGQEVDEDGGGGGGRCVCLRGDGAGLDRVAFHTHWSVTVLGVLAALLLTGLNVYLVAGGSLAS
ncbi:hypothetical protein HK405_004246 [Cladochytrium tenue]|nr:hypothetical protein HK405_004246 [Cladochytrium tenue]